MDDPKPARYSAKAVVDAYYADLRAHAARRLLARRFPNGYSDNDPEVRAFLAEEQHLTDAFLADEPIEP